MIHSYAIWSIARYEAKLLFRSWAFRIFSLLGLFILVSFTIGIGSKIGDSPYSFRALSGSMPLFNIKLLNIYQGIIAIFLATEFFKRDRRHDTTEVIFTRSFTNLDYLAGKLLGIGIVFAVLNIVVLLMAFTIHAFWSHVPFAFTPYIYFTVVYSIPTLTFMIGASLFLAVLLRSQAVVFVIMLGFSLLSLIFLGTRIFNVFDIYALHQPIIYSDFIGAGNLTDVMLLRGAYFLAGIAMLAGTIVFSRRLKQSRIVTLASIGISLAVLVAAIGLGGQYLNTKSAIDDYRRHLQQISRELSGTPTVDIIDHEINIAFEGNTMRATSNIVAANTGSQALDSILLTLNPGLAVASAICNGQTITVNRNEHILWIKPARSLKSGDTCRLDMTYFGPVDERYCYLDIDEERYHDLVRSWLYTIPKRYAMISPDFVYLTSEAGWYPIAGLSPGTAFPDPIVRDFCDFQLTVQVPDGLTAIAQGGTQSDSSGRAVFVPETPLPILSLTIGPYQKHGLEVDSIEYSLYVKPGHEFYERFFDEVSDTLPSIISELKNEYEMTLGLEYPYKRLALVELPIQMYSYRRLWTMSQDNVQPQIVHMPEGGMYCDGTDFDRMKRRGTRRQERANLAEDPKVIQSGYFGAFVRTDLLKSSPSFSWGGNEDVERDFSILPNYVSYRTYLSSERWPVLQYAFESFFARRVSSSQPSRWRIWRGLSDREKANLALKKFALADLIGNRDLEDDIITAAMQNKGQALFTRLEASAGVDKFSAQITEFITSHRYQSITDDDILAFAQRLGQKDFDEALNTWYTETELPGYVVENVDSYRVIDGERTRTQLKLDISNPTAVSGLVQVNLRYRRQGMRFGPFMGAGQPTHDYTRLISMPAESKRSLAILLDDPLAEMTIETYVSRNIPASISLSFEEESMRRHERPEEYDSLQSIHGSSGYDGGELVIDNEDKGFEIIGVRRENWLRRSLRSLFNASDDEETYVGIRFWDPPGIWLATTGQHFYGRFVRSAYHKESGDGTAKVSWTANMEEAGDYDVYCYFEGENQVPDFRRRRGGWNRQQGQRQFFIYHEDGVEEINFDLDAAEEGWNFLGTYRMAAGQNIIEQTDVNSTNIVIADAVKWVKR